MPVTSQSKLLTLLPTAFVKVCMSSVSETGNKTAAHAPDPTGPLNTEPSVNINTCDPAIL